MDPKSFLAAHWWPLFLGGDAALFVAAVILWVADHKPLAGLAFVLAIVPPLSIVAVALDGQ